MIPAKNSIQFSVFCFQNFLWPTGCFLLIGTVKILPSSSFPLAQVSLKVGIWAGLLQGPIFVDKDQEHFEVDCASALVAIRLHPCLPSMNHLSEFSWTNQSESGFSEKMRSNILKTFPFFVASVLASPAHCIGQMSRNVLRRWNNMRQLSICDFETDYFHPIVQCKCHRLSKKSRLQIIRKTVCGRVGYTEDWTSSKAINKPQPISTRLNRS